MYFNLTMFIKGFITLLALLKPQEPWNTMKSFLILNNFSLTHQLDLSGLLLIYLKTSFVVYWSTYSMDGCIRKLWLFVSWLCKPHSLLSSSINRQCLTVRFSTHSFSNKLCVTSRCTFFLFWLYAVGLVIFAWSRTNCLVSIISIDYIGLTQCNEVVTWADLS